MDIHGQLVLGNAHRLEKLLKQDFAGVNQIFRSDHKTLLMIIDQNTIFGVLRKALFLRKPDCWHGRGIRQLPDVPCLWRATRLSAVALAKVDRGRTRPAFVNLRRGRQSASLQNRFACSCYSDAKKFSIL
jgi:hypothetical protein